MADTIIIHTITAILIHTIGEDTIIMGTEILIITIIITTTIMLITRTQMFTMVLDLEQDLPLETQWMT